MRGHRQRGEEAWAQAMISTHLRLKVERHDDGSKPGMYDLKIIFTDGSHAAVEVTACADSESIETWNLMNGEGKVWIVPELRGGWSVAVNPSTRVQKLKNKLPRFLGQLEQAGITQTYAQPTPEWVESASENLGIATVYQGDTDRPGSIYLTIELLTERSGGTVPDHGDSIAEWIGTFLRDPRQEDVLKKLDRAGTSQRHVFVFAPGLTLASWPVPYLLMSDTVPLPTIAPRLPLEATHAWIASTWSTATGVRWSPESGWEHFSKDPCVRVT